MLGHKYQQTKRIYIIQSMFSDYNGIKLESIKTVTRKTSNIWTLTNINNLWVKQESSINKNY